MEAFDNPFFWAFLSATGWAMGMLTVGSKTVGGHMAYGMTGSALAQIPRIVLPLGFVSQPRFEAPIWLVVIAVVVIGISFVFGHSGLGVKIYTRPEKSEGLKTDGLYGIVRHPILLANILFPPAWSAIFGSWIGIACTPIWFLLVYLMSFLEEERMTEEYGDEYREYQKQTPRIIPFIKAV